MVTAVVAAPVEDVAVEDATVEDAMVEDATVEDVEVDAEADVVDDNTTEVVSLAAEAAEAAAEVEAEVEVVVAEVEDTPVTPLPVLKAESAANSTMFVVSSIISLPMTISSFAGASFLDFRTVVCNSAFQLKATT